MQLTCSRSSTVGGGQQTAVDVDAGKKREAYVIEMQKLREGQSRPEQSAVQGRLTISDIKLPLKSEFMSKIGTAQGKLVTRSCFGVLL